MRIDVISRKGWIKDIKSFYEEVIAFGFLKRRICFEVDAKDEQTTIAFGYSENEAKIYKSDCLFLKNSIFNGEELNAKKVIINLDDKVAIYKETEDGLDIKLELKDFNEEDAKEKSISQEDVMFYTGLNKAIIEERESKEEATSLDDVPFKSTPNKEGE